MRQATYIFLIAILLFAPWALRWHALRSSGEAGAASSSGQLRLIVVTPHNQDIRNEFNLAFNRWHQKHYGQSVSIDYRSPGGASDIERQLSTTFGVYRNADGSLKPGASAGIDVAWGGGDYFFERQLKPLGILAPIEIDPAALHAAFPSPTLAGVKLYDYTPDPHDKSKSLPPRWIGVCLSSFGIVYNPDLYKPQALDLPPPRTWADLTVPKLAGFVALADPTHSGSAAVAYMMVMQRAMADGEEQAFAADAGLKSLMAEPRVKAYLSAWQNSLAQNSEAAFLRGPQAQTLTPAERHRVAVYRDDVSRGWKRGLSELLLMGANARYFTDNAAQPPSDVADGEAAAGTAIDFYGRVFEEAAGRDRCRVVLPKAATAITPDPVAILYGAPHPELAQRFVEFLLTPQAQLLWDLKPGTPGAPSRALRRLPIRRDVYGSSPAARVNWSDNTDPFTEANGFNERGEWMDLFSDLQPIWAAMWIDSRDELLEAYHQILLVPDGVRRQELISELADLPIDRLTLERQKAERIAVEKSHQDPEGWKVRKRIYWARRFAEHYRKVEGKAIEGKG